MKGQELAEIKENVSRWLKTGGATIRENINATLEVETKSGPKDLVTNMDKQTERYLTTQIKESYPFAQILGEEGTGDVVKELSGLVFIVDPIDGTMNFVKQHDNFAMMIGVYEDGIGLLGFIYDVMNDALYWGGPHYEGVYCNDQPLAKPADLALKEGLIGVSGPMLIHNKFHLQAFAEIAAGVRILGSAGIEFIQVLQGKQLGYISYLAPWDVAAGKVLAETMGLSVTKMDGAPIDLLSHEVTLIATLKVRDEIANYR